MARTPIAAISLLVFDNMEDEADVLDTTVGTAIGDDKLAGVGVKEAEGGVEDEAEVGMVFKGNDKEFNCCWDGGVG